MVILPPPVGWPSSRVEALAAFFDERFVAAAFVPALFLLVLFFPLEELLLRKPFLNPKDDDDDDDDDGFGLLAAVTPTDGGPRTPPSGFAGLLRPSLCLLDSSSSIRASSSSRLEI